MSTLSLSPLLLRYSLIINMTLHLNVVLQEQKLIDLIFDEREEEDTGAGNDYFAAAFSGSSLSSAFLDAV